MKTDNNLNRRRLLLALPGAVLALGGCGGATRAQKRAFRANEAVSKERLRLVDEYQDCIDRAAGDTLDQRGCERYLRSAEALK